MSFAAFHRAVAAFFAISIRRVAERFFARTSPPMVPPAAPRTAEPDSSSFSSISPVAIRMTWTALPITSAGRFWPWGPLGMAYFYRIFRQFDTGCPIFGRVGFENLSRALIYTTSSCSQCAQNRTGGSPKWPPRPTIISESASVALARPLWEFFGATSAAKIQTRIPQLERASLYWGLLTLCSSKHA